MKDTDLATVCRVVHETIRAYQQALGQSASKPWDEADEWERTSTLEAVKFRLAHPHARPADQHEQWMGEKRAAGWVLGANKDAAKKTHPALVPYEQLPEIERRKDKLIQAVVGAFASNR